MAALSFTWLPGLLLRPLVVALPTALQGGFGLLLFDVGIYWTHRFSHEIPFMWRFHRIYYSTEQLDWVSGFRGDPFDGILAAPAFVFLVVAGFSAEFSGALLVVQIVTGLFLHANVRWRWRPLHKVVLTPEFYHWHHSNEADARSTNYSVFLPVWDIIFGTYFMPLDRRPMVYGIDGDVSEGIVAALSLTCYRILEESLTNVVQHSLAKRVVIQLTSHDHSVAVGIHDPGPPDSASIDPGGRGVRGMRERGRGIRRFLGSARNTRWRIPSFGSHPKGCRVIRVAIVDDHDQMRAALRATVESADLEVVGEASNGDGGRSLVRTTRPDVVLMDVRMPGLDGIATTAAIIGEFPSTKILILTTFDDDDALAGALAAGASGFLLKNSPPESLVRAIRQVADGDGVLDAAVAPRVFAQFARRDAGPDNALLDRLTERERDVLRLVCTGRTNREIANDLGMGDETVKSHVSRVLLKLDVRDRVQAVIYAYQTGFVA